MVDRLKLTSGNKIVAADIVDGELILKRANRSTTVYSLSDVTSAEVDAAIAALVDTAPGTLDTLNELAAALGDDADFAATVISALAEKANESSVNARVPLASPTGTSVESMDNPAGDGNIDVLMSPLAEFTGKALFAAAAEGDDFPRIIVWADPALGIWMGDGITAPTNVSIWSESSGQLKLYAESMVGINMAPGGLLYLPEGGMNVAEGDVELNGGDFLATNAAKGFVGRAPNGTRYRLKFANDGTIFTEVVA